MCVNRQPRPWDQRGRARIISLVCIDLSPCWQWLVMMPRQPVTPDPRRTLQHCLASLFVSSWPSEDWELTSADRWLSPPTREVIAVNAVPGWHAGRGGDGHPCHVHEALSHRGGIITQNGRGDKTARVWDSTEAEAKTHKEIQIFKCGSGMLTTWKMAIPMIDRACRFISNIDMSEK